MISRCFPIVDQPRFDGRLAPGAAGIRKGNHDAHATTRPRPQPNTWRTPRPGRSRPGKTAAEAAEGDRAYRPQNAPTACSKSRRGIGTRQKGPGRLVPLDRNAKVRVMMVARLDGAFRRTLRTFELSTWPRDWRRSTRGTPLLSCTLLRNPAMSMNGAGMAVAEQSAAVLFKRRTNATREQRNACERVHRAHRGGCRSRLLRRNTDR
jgi:hypothetical protein